VCYNHTMNENPFTGKPAARSLYDCLLVRLRTVGSFTEEYKKTSVHIVAGKGAFLGVHPRTDSLLLNIVLDRALVSDRLSKVEQVSKSRYHNEIKLSDEGSIDDELLEWISEAYKLKNG
jgi:hypothetical protein